jgi:hypothetical protein
MREEPLSSNGKQQRRAMVARKLLAVIALLFVFTAAEAAPSSVRAYVLYGQGGRFWARGILDLANKLEKMDMRLQVSVHEWKDHKDVERSIAQLPPETPVVLIGYSAGANAATWISNNVRGRKIDLIVAYDPSERMELESAGKNVVRVLLYHNNSIEPWGHGRIRGPQVETTETRNSHLSVGSSKWLHKKTRAAVSRVLEQLQSTH